jgi:hypothetical protein
MNYELKGIRKKLRPNRRNVTAFAGETEKSHEETFFIFSIQKTTVQIAMAVTNPLLAVAILSDFGTNYSN